MKRTLLALAILVCMTLVLSAQVQKPTYNPAGKWKFEAPHAPVEYSTGTLEFTLSEGKYSATISFTGSEYKIPLEGVRVSNDSVRVSLYVEGADISIRLKMVSDVKIAGVAMSPEGELPLTAVREKQ